MQSHFYHLQLNIDFANKDFYKDLMEFLGWSEIFETEEVMGYKSGVNGDVWFVASDVNVAQNYDHKGLNHLAIRVDQQSDVDECVGYLKSKGVKLLFDTPKHREEFAESDLHTYYQVMFETPDGILVEVVYVGEKY